MTIFPFCCAIAPVSSKTIAQVLLLPALKEGRCFGGKMFFTGHQIEVEQSSFVQTSSICSCGGGDAAVTKGFTLLFSISCSCLRCHLTLLPCLTELLLFLLFPFLLFTSSFHLPFSRAHVHPLPGSFVICHDSILLLLVSYLSIHHKHPHQQIHFDFGANACRRERTFANLEAQTGRTPWF